MDSVKKLNKIIKHSQTLTLPQEIIFEEILPRLPVKTLIRFKFVSKLWYSHISSTKFAKSHLKFSSSRSRFLIFAAIDSDLDYKDVFSLHYNEADCNVIDVAELEFDWKFTDLVGSFNGIICLHVHDFFYSSFLLWNPAIRHSKRIFLPQGHDKTISRANQFYYDKLADDYKIFAAFMCRDDFVCCYVFSLRTGMWRKIDKNFDILEFTQTAMIIDTVYINSSVDKSNMGTKPIVGFDLLTEELSELPWMNKLSKYNHVELLQLRGCLSFLCFPDYYRDLDVWRLEQPGDFNSCRKWFSININLLQRGFSKTGKCLVRDHKELKVFDPSRGTSQLAQRGIKLSRKMYPDGIDFTDYVESLLSPFVKAKLDDEDNEIQENEAKAS